MRIINVIKGIIKAVNFITPKKRKKVMLASFPDFADNARALYEYMMGNKHFNDWSFVWIVSSGFIPPQRNNTLFIGQPKGFLNKEYFIYLFHLTTSKYLFSTHSFFVEAVPCRQESVLLWHGTMLKRICAMNEREKKQGQKKQFRHFVSPSVFYVDFFCKSFLCNKQSVITCGYPRNDFLFEETDVLEKLSIQKNMFDKIIVYMPTFRTPLNGSYSDSVDVNQMCIDLVDTEIMQKLSTFLKERKILLIIKWHPSDIRQTMFLKLDNIVAIHNKALEDMDAQTYHLLHYADALITDYSSVFCDYLLLDRPIAFDVSDIESYSDNRGFVFDNPLDYMPGVKLYNASDFMSFCEGIINGLDFSRNERERLKHVYNDFDNGHNCERLVKCLAMETK